MSRDRSGNYLNVTGKEHGRILKAYSHQAKANANANANKRKTSKKKFQTSKKIFVSAFTHSLSVLWINPKGPFTLNESERESDYFLMFEIFSFISFTFSLSLHVNGHLGSIHTKQKESKRKGESDFVSNFVSEKMFHSQIRFSLVWIVKGPFTRNIMRLLFPLIFVV